MIRRPPRSTLFPTRRSSDLLTALRRGQGSMLADEKVLYLYSSNVQPLYEQDILDVLGDRKSTRLNSSHPSISYAVFCLKKKNIKPNDHNIFKLSCFLHICLL